MENNYLQPHFSVIIPHYNTWCLLLELINSIPQNSDFEVIVIDDCSSIRPEKKIMDEIKLKIQDRNGLFLANNKNIGAGACRNIGLEKARGEWILFADADDFFLSGISEILDRYKNTTADIVYFSPKSQFLHTNIEADRHLEMQRIIYNYLDSPQGKQKYYEIQLRYKNVVPWSKIIRKKVIVEHDIDFEESIVANDVMFSTKCGYFAKKIEASKDSIYCVTSRQESLTKEHNRQKFDIRTTIFVERYIYLKERLSEKDFRMLNITGKGFVSEALLSEKDFKLFWETWRKYRNAGIRTFSVFDIGKDIKHIIERVRYNQIEKKILKNYNK